MNILEIHWCSVKFLRTQQPVDIWHSDTASPSSAILTAGWQWPLKNNGNTSKDEAPKLNLILITLAVLLWLKWSRRQNKFGLYENEHDQILDEKWCMRIDHYFIRLQNKQSKSKLGIICLKTCIHSQQTFIWPNICIKECIHPSWLWLQETALLQIYRFYW